MNSFTAKFTIVIVFLITFSNSNSQVGAYKINSSDISNFWLTYDLVLNSKDSLERIRIVENSYINKGTEGLKAIIKVRNYKPYEFVHAIISYPEFWNSMRNNSLKLDDISFVLDEYISQLTLLYPEFKPCDIYFPIGVFRSAGTYYQNMVLMGAEFYLPNLQTPIHELPVRVINSLTQYMPYDIPLIALHELIHTQQKPFEHLSIVHICVGEGVAEFISTYVAKSPLGQSVLFGKKNEKLVLDVFMHEVFRDDDVFNWVWSKNQNALQVDDLGYYIGYEICERFFNKSKDKKQAIKDLIELDFEDDEAFAKILDGSGFLPLTWKEIGDKYESMRPEVKRVLEFENKSKCVSPKLKTITLEFSEEMSNCCRSFDIDIENPAEGIVIKRMIGWSEDNRRFSFEIETLKPNTKYQLLVSSFSKEDGGNKMKPYLIQFTTKKR